MASKARSSTDHLTYLRLGAQRVQALAPFELLRGAEARAGALPRIGTARLPQQDVVEIAQTPSLAFPAATIEGIAVDDERARVEGHWLGLTGPMAPLPLHISEFASYERRYSKQRPFNGFLDVIAGRMLQLFYRAWASTSSTASGDRPDDDYAADRIAALSGAQDGATDDSAFPARARLRYAPVFITPRSPAGIADALSDLMRMPVRLTEFMPRWRDLEPEDRSTLGGSMMVLGREALAGGRVRTVADAFRVTVTAGSHREVIALLPGGGRHRLLEEAIAAFVPTHLDWDVEIETLPAAMRPARLGSGSRLGWTGWLGSRSKTGSRADIRLGAGARTMTQSQRKEPA